MKQTEIEMIFHSFDSMLDTLVKCYQQSARQSWEQYDIFDNKHEIWEKYNPGNFKQMSLFQYHQ